MLFVILMIHRSDYLRSMDSMGRGDGAIKKTAIREVGESQSYAVGWIWNLI